MVYEYTWSGPQYAVSAEKVAEHLHKLEKENGSVTREDFLESARSEDSEMHKLFEWDDTVAAEKFRLRQATDIIHSIKVTVVEEEKEPVSVRAFVIPDYTGKAAVGNKGGYINIRKATGNTDTKDMLLQDARKNARWFMDKYRSIGELAEVVTAIEGFLERTA